MENLDLEKALEIIEGEAESLIFYEDYRKAIDMIDELKEIFEVKKESKIKMRGNHRLVAFLI